MTSKLEADYWNLCARHEFEKHCGADVKYVSHERLGTKIEFAFEIPELGRMFVIGLDAECVDLIELAVKVARQAQSMADIKLGKFDARMALAKQANEERAPA